MPGAKEPIAVVLLSGGMDSCVTATMAARHHRLALLHSSYGQRTEAREYRAFEEIASRLKAELKLRINQNYMTAIGGSALTDQSIEVPLASPLTGTDGVIPVTYVPFRNAHFLAAATSWAEVIGAHKIFIGAVEQDSAGYPDCRPSYYESFSGLIETGTRPETDIKIETPLIGLSKAEIIRQGLLLNAPLELTWSCYQSSDKPCGACDSCELRRRAFEQAGVKDTLVGSTG